MTNHHKKRSAKAGHPPGTLIHIGERKVDQPIFSVFAYGADHFEEMRAASVEECRRVKAHAEVTWINIDGLHDPTVFEDFGRHFGLHPLVLEDILNTDHRPKTEDYEDYLHVVLKMMNLTKSKRDIDTEQVSLIVGADYVLTFQERPGDLFDPIRDRIRLGKGRIRNHGPDYLAYALIDVVVDNYFAILERLGERIELLEETVINDSGAATVREIHHLKGLLIHMRKAVWPMRELLDGLRKSDSTLIGRETVPFLTDVYDHTIHIIDTIETYRDLLAGMLDIHLSAVSNRMNQVMKVLTVIATVFIPLTFLVGVYGMNFQYMPELHKRWAYPGLWIVMILLAVGMLFFFRRKKWL
ncbi:MAG: magnesium/cobalt transporter CorA [bacterium]|nr:magnesium/cobalt transporter CorA [bacterium]